MDENEDLARRFEAQRPRLRGVAYRMLGSLSEADDALQEAWLHVQRAGAAEVENLNGWLTTIVARVCLDQLRARKSKAEHGAITVPDFVVDRDDGASPEGPLVLADSIGLALLVVLDTLAPAERLAFVLHDIFGVSFEEIATIVGRSGTAARQLASRGRRKIQGSKASEGTRDEQRAIVTAFLAASRDGDFDGLIAVLDPDVVLRADRGGVVRPIQGAEAVAKQSLLFSRLATSARRTHRAWVNGGPGMVVFEGKKPYSILGFTVANGKIAAIDILANEARLKTLELPSWD